MKKLFNHIGTFGFAFCFRNLMFWLRIHCKLLKLYKSQILTNVWNSYGNVYFWCFFFRDKSEGLRGSGCVWFSLRKIFQVAHYVSQFSSFFLAGVWWERCQLLELLFSRKITDSFRIESTFRTQLHWCIFLANFCFWCYELYHTFQNY